MPAARTDGAGGGYQVDLVEPGGTDFRLLDITQIYPLVMLEDTAGMRDAAVAWQNLGGRLDAEARALRGSLTGLAGAWRSAAATEFGERGEAAATSLDRWSAIAAERAGELYDLAVVVAGKKLRMQWIWDDFARAASEIVDRPSGGPTLDPEGAALTDLVSGWRDAGALEDNVRRYTQQALDEVVNPLANRFAESALLFAAPGPVFAGPTDAAVPGDALLAAIVTGAWVPDGVSFPGAPSVPAVPARPAVPGAPEELAVPVLPPDLAPVVTMNLPAVPASAVLPVPARGHPPVPALGRPLLPDLALQPVPVRALPVVPDQPLPAVPDLALPAVPALRAAASVLAPVRVSPSVVAPALPAVPGPAAARASLPAPPRVPGLSRVPVPPTPGVPSASAGAGRISDPATRGGGWGGNPTLAGRRAPAFTGVRPPTDPGAHSASGFRPPSARTDPGAHSASGVRPPSDSGGHAPSAIHRPTGSGRSSRGTHPDTTAAEPGSPSGRTTLPPQLPGRTRPAAQAPASAHSRPGGSGGDLHGRSAPTRAAAPMPPALGSHRAPSTRDRRTEQPHVTIGARRPRLDPDMPATLRPGPGTAPTRQQVPGHPLLGSVARPAGGSPTPPARVGTPSRVTAPSPADERATDRARRRAEWAASRRHQATAKAMTG